MNDTELLAGLRVAADTGNGFAASLLRWHGRYGTFSDRQRAAGERLVSRPQAPGTTEPVVLDFARIADLFERAGSGENGRPLKRPKISLQTPEGKPVRLAVAGERSRYCGDIHVSEAGYGSTYYGRIDRAGRFHGRPGSESILDTLRAFSADPIGHAIAHGRLTGNCCFCELPLTDDRSVVAGYGPVCASNWGLPWGD